MGWIYEGDAGEHEGVIRGVLANGSYALELIGTTEFARCYMDGMWDGGTGAPAGPPAFLEPVCACGWTGDRYAYDPDLAWDPQEDVAYTAWRRHITAAEAHMTPPVLAEALRKLYEALEDPTVTARPQASRDVLARMAAELATRMATLAALETR